MEMCTSQILEIFKVYSFEKVNAVHGSIEYNLISIQCNRLEFRDVSKILAFHVFSFLSLEAFDLYYNPFSTSTRFCRSKSRNARTSGLLAFYWICETANRKVVISERAHLSVTCVRVGPRTVLPTVLYWQFYDKIWIFQ